MRARHPMSLHRTAYQNISVNLPGTEARVPLRVENSSFLEDLSNNGDSGIDRIRNNEYECFRSCRGDTNGQIIDDTSIDLLSVRSLARSIATSTHFEQIISSGLSYMSCSSCSYKENKPHLVI